MKEVTKLMINDFKIKELGYDFMGFSLQKGDIYTFHHLIVPNRDGGKIERWNGAILCGATSHPYLHLIESKSDEIFSYITSEMIDINLKGYLDKRNLREIGYLLDEFESKHGNDTNGRGRKLIKSIYRERNKF